ncbi:MAG TPA: AAA family ATPase [Pseudonocardiaceae bacterium]|nr:AAA family ATPase [Pseudonocardiaceae bacterium]
METTLVVLGGLPATGKSTVAKQAAGRLGAAYVRIDTIEQAIKESETNGDNGLNQAVEWGLGYEVAYAVARDLLKQGTDVFADCVNPMKITRDAWQALACSAGVRLVEVELICSDTAEHRRRVTSRTVDIPNLHLPTWQQVVDRDYEPWDRPHVVLDTAGTPVDDTVDQLCAAVG